MSKNRHHFVPRFYLKAFQSETKRIHLYNLSRRAAIANVSLRDQCYRHRFYGKTDDIENALMDVEKQIAPVVRETVALQSLPPHHSEDWHTLLQFAVLQSLRTTATATRVHSSTEQMAQAIFGRAPEAHAADIEDFLIDEHQAVVLALSNLTDVLEVASDLQMHLVCAAANQQFITSDNPVFKYNLYCEGSVDRGTLGWGQAGFHLFLPLSPSTLLIVYDPRVYRVGTRAASVTRELTSEDLHTLNRMQFVGAAENIYFQDWGVAAHLEPLHRQALAPRAQGGSRVLTYLDEDDEKHGLLHTFEQMANIRLNLSFFRIRRDARRIPFYARWQAFRRPTLIRRRLSEDQEASGGGRSIRFVRPDLHPIRKKSDNG